MMRKQLSLIALSLTFILSLTACSKSASQPNATQTQQQSGTTDHVTSSGGLGDTTEYFQQKYGDSAGKQNTVSYQNNSIQITFNDNRATDIKLLFDKTSKPRRTKEETQTLINNMIPSDAKKISDIKDDKLGEIGTVYESSTLAKVFEKNYKDAEDLAKKIGGKAPKAGVFSVKMQQDQKGISSVVFGLGE